MSDWQFASREGYVTWTSPALPNGGQRLHSVLSPTLLLGYLQVSDTVPVDYVKVPSIRGAALQSQNVIHVERDSGESMLFVCEGEDDARQWLHHLQMAMGNSAQYAETDAGAQQIRSDADWTRPAQDNLSQLLQDDQRQHDVQRGNASTATSAAPHPSDGSLSVAAGNRDQHSLSVASTAMSPRPLPPAESPAYAAERRQLESQQRRLDEQRAEQEHLQASLDAQRQQQRDEQQLLRSQLDQRDADAHGARAQQQQRQDAEHARLERERRQLDQRRIQQDAEQQDAALQSRMQRAPNSMALPADHGVAVDACPTDAHGEHTFRPLPVGSLGLSPVAHTTSVATHQERPLAADSVAYGSPAAWTTERPLAAADQTMSASRVVDPAHLGLSRGVVSGAGPRPIVERQMYDSVQNRSAFLAATPPPAAPMYDGTGKRRSGMIIDMPASQNMQRNVAPNASSVWKEWTGPDGMVYLMHEPTQTLQRRVEGTEEYETMVAGCDDIPEEDLAERSHRPGDTTYNLNSNTVRNVQSYARSGSAGAGMSPGVAGMPASPRGQHSPSRRAPMEALTGPREMNPGYQGKRLHRLTLRGSDVPGRAVVEHQVESLQTKDMLFNKKTGAAFNADPRQGAVGDHAMQRQWEHCRKILKQGRYFKKHAVRSTTEAYRFVFLSGDDSSICCVPTSEVLVNMNRNPKVFGSVADTVQYYGPESRAMMVNSISDVSLGADSNLVLNRQGLDRDSTFVVVNNKSALILECNTPDEAVFYADAWNYYLYYSRPVSQKASRTPQMVAPVTHGTRGGLAF
jgi:hypothetical protein